MITNLSLFNLIYSLNHLTVFSSGLSLFLGEYLIYILGIGAILYLILSKDSKKDEAKWLLVLVLACCLSNMIVNPLIHCFYKLPRPFVVLTEIVNYKNFLKIAEYNTSFPSGHTSLAFAIAVVLFLKNKKAGIIALITATLIGIGRILMGVHWPLDILGGIVVGILCVLTSYQIINKVVTKTIPKE
jgi:undecaprenyl-diphosphatase